MTLTSGSFVQPPSPFPTNGRTLHPHPADIPITLVTVVAPASALRKVVLQPKLDRLRFRRVYPFVRQSARFSMVIEQVENVGKDDIINVTTGSGTFQA
jgi:hypothetical protein